MDVKEYGKYIGDENRDKISKALKQIPLSKSLNFTNERKESKLNTIIIIRKYLKSSIIIWQYA